MTWCSGDSENERFETARAFYVACHQHTKRPGKTLQSFQQALGQNAFARAHVLFAGMRRCLQQVFYRYWRSDGFLIMARDGSRLECPRSKALEKCLKPSGKTDSAPMFAGLGFGIAARGLAVGLAGRARQRQRTRLAAVLLPTLPRRTLLMADAFYQGYDLYTFIAQAKMSFLMRASSRSRLYTGSRLTNGLTLSQEIRSLLLVCALLDGQRVLDFVQDHAPW